MIPIKEKEFNHLVDFVKSRYGINLSQKKTLIESRLSNLLIDRNFETYSEYFDVVMNDKSGNEINELLNKLTTNLTYFMREETHFHYFTNAVLPWLQSTVKSRDLRIWCAGCSTGEEAYTLAMLIDDYFKEHKREWDTKVLATDISQKVLGVAKAGIYPAETVEKLPVLYQMNYFNKIDRETYEVKDKLKKEVIFAPFNLMEQVLPFKKSFHVIFCRNVMIYFDQQTKNALINRYYDASEPGAYLFIGHSESVDRTTTKYNYIMPAVYRKPM